MNKVVHFEIPYDDQGRAQKFYQDVFGWQINKMPDMDYHMVTTTPSDQNMRPTDPGAINGGLLARDPTGQQLPTVGSSPNCSGTFKPDLFTVRDTCGAECDSKYPESFGQKDFAFQKDQPWQTKVTDAHQIHAYQNLRAGMPGEGPASVGAYEWIPKVSGNPPTNSFVWDQQPVFQQVGNFLDLMQFSNLRASNFRG